MVDSPRLRAIVGWSRLYSFRKIYEGVIVSSHEGGKCHSVEEQDSRGSVVMRGTLSLSEYLGETHGHHSSNHANYGDQT